MSPELSAPEISALARIVDELDYYQLLELPHSASLAEVKRAYYARARVFHPDTHPSLGPDAIGPYKRISQRVTEAYCVLRDPRQRALYDTRLTEAGQARIQLAAARASRTGTGPPHPQGTTPQGRQFFQLALQEAERGDIPAALQKVQVALTFEPANEGFAAQRDEWKEWRARA